MADDDLRQDMVDQVREEQQQRQRAPRVHKAPAPRDAATVSRDAIPDGDADHARPGPSDSMAGGPADSADAPKKRRRRRRTSSPREGGAQTPDAGV